MTNAWHDAFDLFYLMMESAWQFFMLQLPGSPIRIWMLFVFIIMITLGVNFVRSFYSRDGDISD